MVPVSTPNSAPKSMIDPQAFGGATLRRIEWLTMILGAIGASWGAWRWGWRGGAGLGLGAALSWINFRWLKSSVQAFAGATLPHAVSHAVSQAPAPPESADGLPSEKSVSNEQAVVSARVPVSAYLKFFGRFALLLAAVYVILTRSWLPAVPVVTGLFAAAAATVLGLIYELASGGVRQGSKLGR
jgi:hypothetical protein